MQNEEATVTKDFNLPNQSNELSRAEEIIEKIKDRFKLTLKEKSITDESHEEIFEDTIRVLDYVGKLSMPAFALEDEMEEYYKLTYISTPALAKTLFFQHYEKIHHPYNLLKNRCFRLIEELDEEYVSVY